MSSINPIESGDGIVLGLGTVVVDHHVRLAQLPEPDTKAEVLSDRYQVGGPVPTALALLSRLGHRTQFIGKWSTDDRGTLIEDDLGRSGIDIGSAVVSPTVRTGFAHVWVEAETGRRSIAAYRGSHAIEPVELVGQDWSGCRALHLDGWSTDAAIEAAQCVRTAGGTVFVDLGSPKPRLEDLLPLVAVANCPLRLMTRLFGEEPLERSAHRLLDLGAGAVTVTDGEQGAWWFDPDHQHFQPAHRIEAVDTNGAGDVFAGALVHASLQGWSPEERLRFASAAAALKCQGLGNRGSLPSLAQIEALLASA